jgi:hypothetical protein
MRRSRHVLAPSARPVRTGRRQPARLAAPAAALGVLLASTLAIGVPTAGAAPRAATPSSTPAVAPPDPQALAAQSANFPYALQLVERLNTQPGGPTDSEADAQALAARIDAGVPLATVVDSVARDDAAVGSLIDAAYESLLHRAADPGGSAYFAQLVARGYRLEAVEAAMAAGPEFRTVNPTLDDRIDAIYQTLLHRDADSAGRAYSTGLVNRGLKVERIVFSLMGSPEYADAQIDSGYQSVLLRNADTGGRAYWRTKVNRAGHVGLFAALAASPESQQFGCDPLASGTCMLPWPNDYYTRADDSTGTGRRVNLKASELPANVSGTHIDPTQLNRSDGFSPGSTLTVQVPGIDLAKSGLPTIDDLNLNGDDSPVILLDTDTGEKVSTWSELDVHDTYDNPAEQPLLVHPVHNLADGHHYVVALRGLKNVGGAPLAAPPVFAAYRDATTSPVAGFGERVDHMNEIFSELSTAGVARSGLYLAWDFTVASTANLTGRLLHMRDDAFGSLGDAAPAFTVSTVTAGTHTGIDKVVDGTFSVPNYLTGTGEPGSTFNEDSSGLPKANGTFTAKFRCVIPTTALTTPARPSLYGHGLFGSINEVTAGNVQDMAAEHNMVFCGTNWVGMSSDDVGTAAGILTDLSGFNKLADRMQQAVLNFLFLGRLLKAANGFSTNAAFQNASHAPVLANGQLYYDGNSQGGIEGGVVTAVAQDLTRSVLGVSAINYSLLLPRSSDFDTYEAVMKPAYPSELDRLLGLSAIQLEWDRAEPDGYANHMTTDPLPNTPAHKVLMQIALGDKQVSDYAADTEARTIGAKTNCPSFDDDRVPDTRLLWGVPCIESFPYDGSAIIYYDSGADLPVLTDTLPVDGHDPHEDPRNDVQARNQKSAFLNDTGGTVIDVCSAGPCHAAQD